MAATRGNGGSILCYEEGIRAKGARVQGVEATGGSARGEDEGLRGKWPLHPTSDHRGPPAVRGKHPNPPPGAGPRAHGRLPST